MSTEAFDECIEAGIRLRNAGRYGEAASFFREHESRFEEMEQVACLIMFEAESLTFEGNFSAARAALERVRNLQPTNPSIAADVLHETARIERAEGNLDGALAKTEQLIATHPDKDDLGELLFTERALILAEMDKCEEALPLLRQAAKAGHNSAYVRFHLGRCSFAAQDYQSAVANLSIAIQDSRLNTKYRAYALLDRGLSYWHLEEYPLAIADFEQCEELGPEVDRASRRTMYLVFATCLKELGRPGEAQERARQAEA
jgi:tetratricopeptide (TPR) repeat protein